MAYTQEMIALVDERIWAAFHTITAAATVVERTGPTTCMVVLDGSSLPVPVKVFGDVESLEGDRVGVVRIGPDWTIIGTFTRRRRITMPDGAVLGTQRMVWGADTPPELAAYGLTVAMLAYVTSSVTGFEVGYFFISVSNIMDAGPGSRALVFGNVTYPTPGDPTSAGVGNVKTNLQMDHWAQTNKTIFKDHDVDIWWPAALMFDGIGFGRGLMGRQDATTATAAIGAETVVFTLPSRVYRDQRCYEFHMGAETSQSGGVATQGIYRIRQTNLTGALWRTWVYPLGSSGSTHTEGTTKVRRVTGSDLTTAVVLTAAGTGANIVMDGAAAFPREFEVVDKGSANDYPNATQI